MQIFGRDEVAKEIFEINLIEGKSKEEEFHELFFGKMRENGIEFIGDFVDFVEEEENPQKIETVYRVLTTEVNSNNKQFGSIFLNPIPKEIKEFSIEYNGKRMRI